MSCLRKYLRQPLILKLAFHVICIILFTSLTCQTSYVKALWLWKNLCSWKNWIRRKSLIKKEKEKKKTRNKERVPFCRLELAELHGGVQISNIEVAVKPKLVIHKFKKGFSFYIYASTSLDTKTLTIAPNRTFESCMSIRCLTSQHIFRFLHFYRVSPIGYLSRKIFIHCHWH